MVFTYDPTTDIGRVRRTLPQEKSVATYTLTDEEIQSYLTDMGVWQLAAAQALDDLASDQAYVLKITTNSAIGISVNAVAVSAELRARAKAMRDDYATSGAVDDAMFDVAETDWESLI
jgi:hypothetical protein